jgi:hypothetical protein
MTEEGLLGRYQVCHKEFKNPEVITEANKN